MPFADGVYGRSAGQAYARAKAGGAEKKAEGADDSKHGSEDQGKGPVIHVKHHGGGKFSVKHEDGSVTKHESPEDLHEHMAQHFGLDQPAGTEGDDEYSSGEDYEGEGGDALKSILG